mmetsp:Transcript_78676/g.138758  ORF Transcript_78676/g.138758 Transcript_78676/m.138758 type:complete len:90 (+) Transcript_78676:88-357(+)
MNGFSKQFSPGEEQYFTLSSDLQLLISFDCFLRTVFFFHCLKAVAALVSGPGCPRVTADKGLTTSPSSHVLALEYRLEELACTIICARI